MSRRPAFSRCFLRFPLCCTPSRLPGRAGLGPYLAPQREARKEEEREGRRKRRKRKERKRREREGRKEEGISRPAAKLFVLLKVARRRRR